MAKAAELDKNLVDGLKAAKSKRAYFALVLKGSNDGALIISKTKVPPADIAAAKKQSGGAAVLKGFCQNEEGRYFFETAKEAPATAAQAVKIIAKRDAGMAIIAEFRVSTDPELLADDGDATVTTASTVQPKQDDGAAVIKRFHDLSADITAALGGPNKDRVKTLFAAIREQLQKKDFAAATKNIDELDSLVKPAPAAAATPAPQDGAAVGDRLKAMTPEIKTALAGPNQARVKALFVAVSGQIKNKDFVPASKALDELESLLKPAAGPSASDLAAEWKTKLTEWTPAIKAALTAKGPSAAAIGKLLAQASALSKPGGDMAQAIAQLTECHALATAGAASQTDGKTAGKKISPAFAQLWSQAKEVWRDAVDTINSQLEKLRSALLNFDEKKYPEIASLSPETKEKFKQQLKAVAEGGLSQLVDSQRVALQVALVNVDQAADDAKKAKSIADAHALVKNIQNYVGSAEKIEVCDDNGLDVVVTIRSELGGALGKLDEALAKAFVS